MQISFHTKRLHLMLLLGDDADPNVDSGSESEPGTFVSLVGGDLTPAPVEEETWYEDEPEARHGFGVSPISTSNARRRRSKPSV